MAPIGKLYGFSGNSRFRRAKAVAILAGLDVETDPNFTMKDAAWKTPEFLAKFPFGYLPAYEGADGVNLQECGAIADYFASLAPNANLVPQDVAEAAEAREWQYFADQEIMIRLGLASKMINNRIPYNKGVYDAIVNEVIGRLEVLNKVLLKKTYLVGERISVADIFLATSLTFAFSAIIDASVRAKIPNVVRYVYTIVRHPKLVALFDNGKPEFIEKAPQYTAPAKEKKEKAPKAEKPKEAAKPKAKEAEAPAAAAAPVEEKPKNPLDLLPKSSFNLEEWKRQYSNLDTRGPNGSLEWFYKNFDNEGFSVWRIDFKYNEDLTLPFMSANQIGGLFARFEASRKYLFGSVGVLGKANDSVISGILIMRGQEAEPVVSVAPDWESYEFTKLSLDKPEDKAFFEAACAWDLELDGRQWADGKNYK